EEIKHFVEMEINKIDILRLEYYEISDAETLQPIRNLNEAKMAIGCIAVYAGDVRLIDNIRYK
ncbi:MAG: pantoate--beta-alanine ligase, partial [Bacteroidales bacterium]|nr:pantoate--beta-alanine ligase [Bacteroidales bacterium]